MRPPPGVIVLIPSAREFDRGLRRGIVEYAQTHAPWIFYEESPPYVQTLGSRQRLRNMRSWQAQGAIVPEARLEDVKSLGIPTVVSVETHRLASSYNQVRAALRAPQLADSHRPRLPVEPQRKVHAARVSLDIRDLAELATELVY